MKFLSNPVLRSRIYSMLPFRAKRRLLDAIDADFNAGNSRSDDGDLGSNSSPLSVLYKFNDFSLGFIALSGSPLVPAFRSACRALGIVGEVFDPSSESFFEKILRAQCHCFLVRPEYKTSLLRDIFDEKVVALRAAGVSVFPSEKELRVYESKRELAMFLNIFKIPHPNTKIFFVEHEALEFLENASYPIVFKSNRGAASSGVEILETKNDAIRLIRQIFGHVYFGKRVGDLRDFDYGYAVLQEFLPNVREFRVIKIGDSWFGHEKACRNGSLFMSGSGLNKWTPPSFELLDFCEEIARNHGFNFMCFDVFQTQENSFLINELQTWFGSYNDSQMFVGDKPGRYVKVNGQWIFQEGLYNVNGGMNLRLIELANILKRGRDD